MSVPTPLVSVVMTVFNGERFLGDAIGSILTQTFCDFELLVVDDASSDATSRILRSLADTDHRIRVLTNKSNLGPYPSANRALELARAPMIARMDADDVSEPERLATQMRFLSDRPDYLMVATSYRAIDASGRVLYTKRKPADDMHLRFLLYFRMPCEHPSMMFRARLPDGSPVRYATESLVAQDYALVTSLSRHGKVAILPDVLFNYRIHDANITATRRSDQARTLYSIARRLQITDWAPEIVEALDGLLRSYLLREKATLGGLRRALAALLTIRNETLSRHPMSRHWLDRQIAEILAHAFLRNGSGGRDLLFCAGFGLLAVGHLPHLAVRYAENAGWLPRALESFPSLDG